MIAEREPTLRQILDAAYGPAGYLLLDAEPDLDLAHAWRCEIKVEPSESRGPGDRGGYFAAMLYTKGFGEYGHGLTIIKELQP